MLLSEVQFKNILPATVCNVDGKVTDVSEVQPLNIFVELLIFASVVLEISAFVNAAQPSNAEEPIFVTCERLVISVSAVQPAKAEALIVTALEGSVKLVNAVQFWNIFAAILFSESFNATVVSEVQPLNIAPFALEALILPISAVVKPVQFSNALAPIVVAVVETLVKAVQP